MSIYEGMSTLEVLREGLYGLIWIVLFFLMIALFFELLSKKDMPDKERGLLRLLFFVTVYTLTQERVFDVLSLLVSIIMLRHLPVANKYKTVLGYVVATGLLGWFIYIYNASIWFGLFLLVGVPMVRKWVWKVLRPLVRVLTMKITIRKSKPNS